MQCVVALKRAATHSGSNVSIATCFTFPYLRCPSHDLPHSTFHFPQLTLQVNTLPYFGTLISYRNDIFGQIRIDLLKTKICIRSHNSTFRLNRFKAYADFKRITWWGWWNFLLILFWTRIENLGEARDSLVRYLLYKLANLSFNLEISRDKITP